MQDNLLSDCKPYLICEHIEPHVHCHFACGRKSRQEICGVRDEDDTQVDLRSLARFKSRMLLLLYMVCAGSIGLAIDVRLSSRIMWLMSPSQMFIQTEMLCLLRTSKPNTVCMWVYMVTFTVTDQTQSFLVAWKNNQFNNS